VVGWVKRLLIRETIDGYDYGESSMLREDIATQQEITTNDVTRDSQSSAGDATVAAEAGGPIVFFDGVCGFCNRSVDFVLARDRRGIFRFAPLQGETAQRLLSEADVRDLNSIVLIEGDAVFRKSTAVARILSRLGGLWGFLGAFLRLVPRPLRDLGYATVARWRYAIFGKREACRMPTPAERARFLP
jgi:predicted DCC family thiol-disulfide oxidoreductase YuxK